MKIRQLMILLILLPLFLSGCRTWTTEMGQIKYLEMHAEVKKENKPGVRMVRYCFEGRRTLVNEYGKLTKIAQRKIPGLVGFSEFKIFEFMDGCIHLEGTPVLESKK